MGNGPSRTVNHWKIRFHSVHFFKHLVIDDDQQAYVNTIQL